MNWESLLTEEISKEYFLKLAAAVKESKEFFPPAPLLFRAFELTNFEDIRVVIVGQDPYHGKNQANGLAFSVDRTEKLPPSLRNIFAEVHSDVGVKNDSGDLTNWATQGVFLLNAILSVKPDMPGSHANLGWETFTSFVISGISSHLSSVVFMLWGAHAQSKAELIDSSKHLLLKAPHPSPLSASRGFFGCKHFSQANNYLALNNRGAIDWSTK